MPKAVRKIIVVIVWLLIWQAISMAVGNTLLLAGPVDTLVRLASDVMTATFWGAVVFSAVRIVLGFVIAFVLALVLGTLAWRVAVVREFLAPAVSFIKSVPVVCIIVLLLVWMGSSWVSVVAVALMVFPPVYVNYLEGLNQADERMVQMLDVFAVNPWRRVRYYYLPLVLPFVASAAKVVVGISWKAGVAAEVIGIPNGSIGAGIYLSKIGLDTAGLFAWTLVIVLLSIVCEKVFLRFLEGASAWSSRLGKAGGASGDMRDSDSSSSTDGGIVFDGVSFGYGADRRVMSGFTQAFEAKSRYCLMGPSGAGKTTLLGLACGLLKPDEGSVSGLRRTGMAFQDERLLEQLSAWNNVQLTSGLSSEDSRRLKSDLDEMLGWDCADLPIASCSGGMMRKISLARALAAQGEALFLDEPFAGMDDASRKDAIGLILRHLRGRLLVVVTHDAEDAALLDAEVVRV